MNDFENHSEFIHEIANHITISEGCLRRALKSIEKGETSEKSSEYVEMGLKYIEMMSKNVKIYREFINKNE